MIAAELEIDRAVAGFEQALQLEHALARNDDLARRADAGAVRGLDQRQTMPVGRDAAQACARANRATSR